MENANNANNTQNKGDKYITLLHFNFTKNCSMLYNIWNRICLIHFLFRYSLQKRIYVM